MIKGRIYLTGFGETRFIASVHVIGRWYTTEASYASAEGAKQAMRELVSWVLAGVKRPRIKWEVGP